MRWVWVWPLLACFGCVDAAPGHPECSAHADCDPGRICRPSLGTCGGPLPAGFACVADEECEPGTACQIGCEGSICASTPPSLESCEDDPDAAAVADAAPEIDGASDLLRRDASPVDAAGDAARDAARDARVPDSAVDAVAPDAVAPGNVCGGRVILDGGPGDACEVCGVLVCDGVDALRCEGGAANACGGCTPLAARPGDVCAGCGHFECDGEERLRCRGGAGNACRGCGDLGGQQPGDPCEGCGQLACDGPEALVCAEVPEPEDCDGRDNDCDAEVDEALERGCNTACGPGRLRCTDGAWQPCDAPQPEVEGCDGRDEDCDGRVDEGLERACETACGVGRSACAAGEWGECSAGAPRAEACNGADDDCDGDVDEGLVRACEAACGLGETSCVAGGWADCVGPPPELEICNGQDEDCDGQIDEALVAACEGVCGVGEVTCRAGEWGACEGQRPVPEACNGADDDCDGRVDEAVSRVCAARCGPGRQLCADGAWGECQGPEPAPEACNGADDDCDGAVDEAYAPRACGLGVCRAESGCVGGQEIECAPGEPAANDAVCDGLDEDCDGRADEDFVPEGCGVGFCAAQSVCDGGLVRACEVGEPLAGADASCDGVDDDCDAAIDEGYRVQPCGVGVCRRASACAAGVERACAPGPAQGPDDACDGADDDCDGRVDEGFAPIRCGVGACERVVGCAAGEVAACVPGEPLLDDAICNDVDDDCDGAVDEDCLENRLEFERVDSGPGWVVVAIRFRSLVPVGLDPSDYLPELIDLSFDFDAQLSLPEADDELAAAITVGAVVVAAGKSIRPFRPAPQTLRLLIVGLNTNPIHPGELARVRFTREGEGPYDLNWLGNFTNFAPQEPDRVLAPRDAVIEVE